MTPPYVVGLYTPDLATDCMASAAPLSAHSCAYFGRLKRLIGASCFSFNEPQQLTFGGAKPMRRLLEALGDVADMIGGAGYRVREALSPSARTVDTPPPRVEQTLTDADVSDYARATEASLGLVLSTMAVGSEEAARQTAIGYVLAAGTFLARVGMRP